MSKRLTGPNAESIVLPSCDMNLEEKVGNLALGQRVCNEHFAQQFGDDRTLRGLSFKKVNPGLDGSRRT